MTEMFLVHVVLVHVVILVSVRRRRSSRSLWLTWAVIHTAAMVGTRQQSPTLVSIKEPEPPR